MMRILQKLRRRLDGDDGFTLVEAMVSITILAVGAFTIAQAMIFGLGSTGLSRQRLASRAALDQQMEQARALNYDNLVLSDATNLTHSTDPNNPDYYVNQVAQTYDPDGAGSMAAEPLVRVAGASPALQHYQNPYTNGGTTYEVYRYVTWYDSPQDGTGAGDAADGNHNGVSDANGHDAKRVTVVVVWTNNVTGQKSTLSESSLFSDGQINYTTPTHNNAPTVGCPTTSIPGWYGDVLRDGVRLRRDDRQRLVELRRRADRDGELDRSRTPTRWRRPTPWSPVWSTTGEFGFQRCGGCHGDCNEPDVRAPVVRMVSSRSTATRLYVNTTAVTLTHLEDRGSVNNSRVVQIVERRNHLELRDNFAGRRFLLVSVDPHGGRRRRPDGVRALLRREQQLRQRLATHRSRLTRSRPGLRRPSTR